jgi:hypothetical protein
MELHQLEKLLHSKGNYYQREDAAYRMGKIFTSSSPDKGLIQKIEHWKSKQSNQ